MITFLSIPSTEYSCQVDVVFTYQIKHSSSLHLHVKCLTRQHSINSTRENTTLSHSQFIYMLTEYSVHNLKIVFSYLYYFNLNIKTGLKFMSLAYKRKKEK